MTLISRGLGLFTPKQATALTGQGYRNSDRIANQISAMPRPSGCSQLPANRKKALVTLFNQRHRNDISTLRNLWVLSGRWDFAIHSAIKNCGSLIGIGQNTEARFS